MLGKASLLSSQNVMILHNFGMWTWPRNLKGKSQIAPGLKSLRPKNLNFLCGKTTFAWFVFRTKPNGDSVTVTILEVHLNCWSVKNMFSYKVLTNCSPNWLYSTRGMLWEYIGANTEASTLCNKRQMAGIWTNSAGARQQRVGIIDVLFCYTNWGNNIFIQKM